MNDIFDDRHFMDEEGQTYDDCDELAELISEEFEDEFYDWLNRTYCTADLFYHILNECSDAEDLYNEYAADLVDEGADEVCAVLHLRYVPYGDEDEEDE